MCLAQLKRIINETGARISLSTTRQMKQAMCACLLQALGASGIEEAAVLGDTPTLAGGGRGHEIASLLVTYRIWQGGARDSACACDPRGRQLAHRLLRSHGTGSTVCADRHGARLDEICGGCQDPLVRRMPSINLTATLFRGPCDEIGLQ